MSNPSTNESQQANPNPGRDAKGRFMPGNPGGPGNPFGRKVAALRQALVDSSTPEDVQEVMQSLKQQAKAGSLGAAKLYLQYTIGKPQPAPEPDHMDSDEWESFQQAVVMKEQSTAVLAAGEPEHHLKLVRIMRPIISEIMQQQIIDKFNETPEERQRREDADAAECQRFLDRMRAARREAEEAELADSNGDLGAEAPLANGKTRRDPSPNGDFDEGEPLANGKTRRDPSPNGDFDEGEPLPNGKTRRDPSPNGKKRPPEASNPGAAPGDGRFVVT